MNRRVSPLTGLPGNVQIQSEMKKRLWGLIWTVVIVIASVWLLGWLLSKFNVIMSAIRSMGSAL